MDISVIGLGYVGAVSAACLAGRGRRVVGVDVDETKVATIEAGRTPVVEAGLGELIAEAVDAGKLRATTDIASAVHSTTMSLVCVGTPSTRTGGLSTVYLERVCIEVGRALAAKPERHTVVIRSTMLPGTCEELLIPLIEDSSGLTAGRDFGIAVNPEFLREGTSIKDFNDPAKTVIGALEPTSGGVVEQIYDGLPGPVFHVPIKVAEMTKYVDNSFHALKVGFANELGAVCAAVGIDSYEVMDIFLADRKLNISPAYLRPGFAFGGSCLPKDLRGLVHLARHADVDIPILESVLPSNEAHIRRAVDLVVDAGHRRVGMFGLSFKQDTDDLRESPLVELAERLLGKGFDLRIFDPSISLARLTGANLEHITTRLPHLNELLHTSVDEVLDHAQTCVVGRKDPEVLRVLPHAEQLDDRVVIDLVRLSDAAQRRDHKGYRSLGW